MLIWIGCLIVCTNCAEMTYGAWQMKSKVRKLPLAKIRVGASEEERQKWMWEKTASKVKMFWYFVVCVWRNLQEEENPLTPSEAYWLGAVDEVLGTSLSALRWADHYQ